MNSNFSLGDRLRELRQARSMSQEQIAHIAELTPAYLGQVERGAKNITVHKLESVCKALNITPADFFSTTKGQDKGIDEISSQILHQLTGKSKKEKQAILRMVKLIFSIQDLM